MNKILLELQQYAEIQSHEHNANVFSILHRMNELEKNSEEYSERHLDFKAEMGQHLAYQEMYFKIKRTLETMESNTCCTGSWISVKDRLPEEHGEMNLYLVCVEGTEYPFRAFWDGRNWGDGISEVDVKYWMPLPEPPKEVQE